MVSNEEKRQAIQEALERAARLLELSNYRLAYQTLQAVEDDVKQHEVDFPELKSQYDDLVGTARRNARGKIKEAREHLDIILRQPVAEFDEEETRAALRVWETNLLTEEDPLLDSYTERVDQRSDDYSYFVEAETVRQEVEGLWNQAKQLKETSKDITPGELYERFYNRAYDTVREASAAHPTNSVLAALLAQAKNLRDKAGEVEGIVTSGGQLGDYRRVLDFFAAQSEDSLVPFYNRKGEFLGNFSREEAIEKTMVEARAYARQKAAEYRNEASTHLTQGRPREALGSLLRYQDGLDEFLEVQDRDRMTRMEDEIRQDTKKLEEAERIAEEARRAARNNGLKAWQQYLQAQKTHAGVRQQERIVGIGDDIIERLRQELGDHQAKLDVIFERADFQQVVKQANEVLRNYQEIDVRLEDALAAIQDLQTRADRAIRDQQDVIQTLEKARKTAREGEPGAALEAVIRLENRFEGDYLERFPLYEEVKSEINVRADASKELERLGIYKKHQDPVQVERARDNARKAGADRDDDFAMAFNELADELNLHLEYLIAVREFNDWQLDQAEGRLQRVLQDKRAPDYREADELLGEVQDAASHAANLDQMLTQASELIAQGQPETAFQLLRDSARPSTRKDRRRVDELLERARQDWRRLIEEEFKAITIETPVNREAIETSLEDLEVTLETPEVRVRMWRNKLQPYLQAAGAVEAEAVGEYDRARDYWEEARRLSTSKFEEQRFIDRRVAALDKTITRNKQQNLLGRVGNAGDERLTSLAAELTDLAVELSEKAKQYPSDSDYAIWHIQIMLTEATLTQDARKRRILFTNAAEAAREIRLPSSPEADTILRRARLGPDIGQEMKRVEDLLGANKTLGELQEAVQSWENQLAPAVEDFPFLKTWYAEHVEAVVDDLRRQVGDVSTGIDLNHLQPLAKLLVLGSPQGQPLLNGLVELSMRMDGQVDELLQGMETARGYEKSRNVSAMIDAQIADFEYHRQNLETVRSLLRQFSVAPQLRQRADTLERNAKQRADTLREVLRRLTVLKHNYEAATGHLGMGIGRQEEAEELYRTMELDFPTHPMTVELKRQLSGIKTGVADVQRRLKTLRQAMETEDFQEAYAVMNGIKPDELQSFGLDGTLAIPDKWRKRQVNTWVEIRTLVSERMETFRIIQDWFAPFDTPALQGDASANGGNGFGADSTTQMITTGGASWVIDWDSAKQRIYEDLEAGRFDMVRWRVQHVCSNRQNGEFMCLEEALEHAENPPVAEPGTTRVPVEQLVDASSRYRYAMQHAGSIRAQEILTWVKDYCVPLYRRQLTEAEELVESARRREKGWQQYDKQFQAVLKQMATAMTHNHKSKRSKLRQRAKIKLNSRSRSEVAAALSQADAVLGELYRICPQHPLLADMRGHVLLVSARTLLARG